MISKRFTLNSQDLSSISRGAVVAVLGALAVYIADSMGKILGAFQIPPEYMPIATMIASVLVNALRKFASQTKY